MLLSTALSARITNDLRERRRPPRRHALGGRRSSRPLIEVLEDRTLLNVDFVSNTNNSGTGSLRATISSASPGDTIKFESGVTGTITLTSGELPLAQNLDIEGPGANNLTISGNDASQVFDVKVGVTATIARLTIAHGTGAEGGGIYNAGTLTVSNSTLSGNAVSVRSGGGIFAGIGYGGGIYNVGTLTVENSTLSANAVYVIGLGGHGYGGGIYNVGTLTVENSTLFRNEVKAEVGYGGGIDNEGTLTVTNSTLSGNSAVRGGGIYNTGTANIANTIVATNTAPTGPDVDGNVASKGYNLIGNSSGGSGFVATDLLDVNPVLGPLQSNGGPTETMALLPGSPAIAAGSVALIPPGITTDQRGSARIVNGTVDIGAFESRGFTITVTSGNKQRSAIDTAFAAPLVVTVSSPYGEPVTGGVVTYTAPAKGASATFPGGSNTGTINASGQAGIAVAANGIPGRFALSASARGAAGTSFHLTSTQGPPAQLVIHTQPKATATAGQAFATQPVIYVEDQHGNLETGDNSTRVTAGLKTGMGPLHGTTTVRVVGGIARFSGLADNKAGSIVLVFTSGTLAKATSNKITISSGSGKGMVVLNGCPSPETAARLGKCAAKPPPRK